MLKNLTKMEEMLIALVQPMMQVQYTKGGQLCYQDYIVNFPQDVSSIATCLPCLAGVIKAIIIWQDNVDMSCHIDFIVHCKKVQCALEYKIAHDLNYAGMHISNNTLLQLPEMAPLWIVSQPVSLDSKMGEIYLRWQVQ